MVIDQSNQRLMYACGLDQGVNKTTNGGLTWTQMNNGSIEYSGSVNSNFEKYTIKFLYAGTNFGANEGVYKTTNGGTSWTQSEYWYQLNLLVHLVFKPLLVHPDNPNIAW